MSKDNYKFEGIGLTTKERNKGKKKFADYLKIYPHLDKLSSLQLLDNLVFLEILEDRYKEIIGRVSKTSNVKETPIIRNDLKEAYDNNTKQILILKEKLGLFSEKENLDVFKHIQDAEERFKLYRKQHPLEFKTTCPFCSAIYFLKRKTKNFEPHKSPFFNGGSRILNNPEIMDWYHKGIITKEMAAKAHGTSVDYIDWLDEKFYKEKDSDKTSGSLDKE